MKGAQFRNTVDWLLLPRGDSAYPKAPLPLTALPLTVEFGSFPTYMALKVGPRWVQGEGGAHLDRDL